MIARVWHGWTTPAAADAYETLLREEVLPAMAEQAGDGFCGAEVLRRAEGEEVAFVTIRRFASMAAVRRGGRRRGDGPRPGGGPRAPHAVRGDGHALRGGRRAEGGSYVSGGLTLSPPVPTLGRCRVHPSQSPQSLCLPTRS